MKNRYKRLANRYKRLRTSYRTRRTARRSRRRASSPKMFTMTWFKRNWLMLAAASVALYFFNAKFKAFADEKVLTHLKKTT